MEGWARGGRNTPLALLRRWRTGGGRNTPIDPPEEMEGLGLEEHTLRPYSGDGGLEGRGIHPLALLRRWRAVVGGIHP